MLRNRIVLFPLVFFLVLLLVLPGCIQKQGELTDPEPGPEDEEPEDKEPQDEEPEDKEPKNEEPQVFALEGTDIRTLELMPASHNFRNYNQFFSYYTPANVDVLCLKDIFGAEYPLPRPKDVHLPTTEGAVWRGDKLYYLSRRGIDEGPDGLFFYEYNTATHTAAEHQLNFPKSFSPESFFVTREREVFLVGETGTYKYTLAKKTLKKVAEFALNREILARAEWHPNEPQLIYSEGNKLMVVDVLSGESTVLYQAAGAISEFFMNDFRELTLLAGNKLDVLDENGMLLTSRFLNSSLIGEGAYSFSWVPDLNMVSYLVPAGSDALPQLVIEDFEKGLCYNYRDCVDYIWSSFDKIWTFSEDEETGTANLVFSHINWEPGQNQKVEIPYFKSREEDPKVPLNYAQGDFEKIAAELFTLHMEDLKSQGSITGYKLLRVSFKQEEIWGFHVCIDYSVQSSDVESWQSGNGELGKDGWVNNKTSYMNIYRDGDSYVMGSQWSTSP